MLITGKLQQQHYLFKTSCIYAWSDTADNRYSYLIKV